MIAKERLEELIKNKETIWGITDDSEILEIFSPYLHHPKRYGTDEVIQDMWNVAYNNDFHLNVFTVEKDYSNIFENKSDAKWILTMNDSRVEKFEPPTWKEILKRKKTEKIVSYNFSVPNLYCRGKILVMQTCINVICGYFGYCEFSESFGEANAKNYIKAVKLARQIFNGEKLIGGNE